MIVAASTPSDPWSNPGSIATRKELVDEARRFVHGWQEDHLLEPAFQLTVTRMARFLQDLSRWIERAEASIAPEMRVDLDLYESIKAPVIERLVGFFHELDQSAAQIAPERVSTHRAFAQRELHPLLLCAPFVHRSYTKPLGYPGDYGIVEIMLDEPRRGPNIYAQILNAASLATKPAVAHCNRIEMLVERLQTEAQRAAGQGRRLRLLDVGCGPAAEIERFIMRSELSDLCTFQLMDFNAPTLAHARGKLEAARATHHRRAELEWNHRSIHDLLRDAVKGSVGREPEYDVIFCAGLYDYLTDRVCRRLTQLFYSLTKPGGLIVTTNVHPSNPVRCYMEFVLEWYLEYRDEAKMLAFAENLGEAQTARDQTGVNVFLDIRRPGPPPMNETT